MQVLSTLITFALAATVALADVTAPVTTAAVYSYPSGALTLCVNAADCFAVRKLNDTSGVQHLAAASLTARIAAPEALVACFGTALDNCVAEDTTLKAPHSTVEDEKSLLVARGGTVQSIPCIFVPWGMLCNGMN